MHKTVAILLLFLPVASVAQEEPPEGCFCLADSNEGLPQIQRGCRREKFPNQFFWRAICRYVDADGNHVVAPAITLDERWIILPADHPDCEICEPRLRTVDTVPRNEDADGQ